jgi:antirestriction protein
MIETATTPRVWIGCLGCYNAGRLVGDWIDATEAEGYEPHDALKHWGTASKRGELAERPPCLSPESDERWCFDLEGFGGLLRGECSPMEAAQAARLVEAIEAEGYPVEAVAAWIDWTGSKVSDVDLDTFAEDYAGEAESEEAFAEQLAEDCGLIDDDASWPNTYIDWERAARDLFLGGDYYSSEAPSGGLYVFRAS